MTRPSSKPFRPIPHWSMSAAASLSAWLVLTPGLSCVYTTTWAAVRASIASAVAWSRAIVSALKTPTWSYTRLPVTGGGNGGPGGNSPAFEDGGRVADGRGVALPAEVVAVGCAVELEGTGLELPLGAAPTPTLPPPAITWTSRSRRLRPAVSAVSRW